tara:strand:- start:51 stop:797 length:747 start_codon:yes stop_codon:yes gene_type:complete
MFFFYGVFLITIAYFLLLFTNNNIKIMLFNAVSYIKHKIDEPKRIAKARKMEEEMNKSIIETIVKVILIFSEKEIEITDIFKNEFLESKESNDKFVTTMEDFVDVVDNVVENDIPDEDSLLYVEYTYLGNTYKAILKESIVFPFYDKPKPKEKLFPKRKVLSSLIGNNTDISKNSDITKIMREYAGPMHSFHSEFGGIFKPSYLLDDESFCINEIFDEDDNCVDQVITMIDSRAKTYVTSLYDSDFEW